MRKLSLTLAIVTAVISAPTMAQNVTYACQFIRAAGLEWIENRWEPKQFHVRDPFFLITDNDALTKQSVSDVIGTPTMFLICSSFESSNKACSGHNGTTLAFNTKTMAGGASWILGSTQVKNSVQKDTLLVSPFTCTKM